MAFILNGIHCGIHALFSRYVHQSGLRTTNEGETLRKCMLPWPFCVAVSESTIISRACLVAFVFSIHVFKGVCNIGFKYVFE